MKNNLHNKMSFIGYVHVIVNVLVFNERNISKIYKDPVKKLHDPFLKNSYHNSVTPHDPDKVIFNFSGHTLIVAQKCLLRKGLNAEMLYEHTLRRLLATFSFAI